MVRDRILLDGQVADDSTVLHPDNSAGVCGDVRFVGDHNDRLAFPVELFKQIHDAAKTSSNWVFGANLALVGASNFAQFPRIFGKGFRGEAAELGRHIGKAEGAFKSTFDEVTGRFKP